MRSIALYQWSHPRLGQNMGDALSAWVLERELGRSVRVSGPAQADLFAIGSILEHLGVPAALPKRRLTNGFGLIRRPARIWGSGFLLASSRFRPLRPVRIHALRGPLSRRKIGPQAAGAALGEPGLLVGRHVSRAKPDDGMATLVPHYVDLERARAAVAGLHSAVTLVDVLRPIDECLERIANARSVLSSSLHGLVIADALGIPSHWVRFGGWPSRSRFKFIDYFLGSAGACRPCTPISAPGDVLRAAGAARIWLEPVRLAEVQNRLLAALPAALRVRSGGLAG